MELRFKRKLSTNKFGYTYLAMPAEIVRALACEYVDLVVENGRIVIAPAD